MRGPGWDAQSATRSWIWSVGEGLVEVARLEPVGGGVVVPPVHEHRPAGIGSESERDVVGGQAQPVAPGVVTYFEGVVQRLEDHVLVDERQVEVVGELAGSVFFPLAGRPVTITKELSVAATVCCSGRRSSRRPRVRAATGVGHGVPTPRRGVVSRRF